MTQITQFLMVKDSAAMHVQPDDVASYRAEGWRVTGILYSEDEQSTDTISEVLMVLGPDAIRVRPADVASYQAQGYQAQEILYGTNKILVRNVGDNLFFVDTPNGDDFMQTSITLNNAQIKDAGTPYVIVPATETLDYSGSPTQIPIPISVIISVNSSAGAYEDLSGDAYFSIALGSDWSYDLMTIAALSLDAGNDCQIYMPQYTRRTTGDTVTPAESVLHSHPLAPQSNGSLDGNLQDNALVVVLGGNGGDLSGGNDENSLTVTVIYVVVDL